MLDAAAQFSITDESLFSIVAAPTGWKGREKHSEFFCAVWRVFAWSMTVFKSRLQFSNNRYLIVFERSPVINASLTLSSRFCPTSTAWKWHSFANRSNSLVYSSITTSSFCARVDSTCLAKISWAGFIYSSRCRIISSLFRYIFVDVRKNIYCQVQFIEVFSYFGPSNLSWKSAEPMIKYLRWGSSLRNCIQAFLDLVHLDNFEGGLLCIKLKWVKDEPKLP